MTPTGLKHLTRRSTFRSVPAFLSIRDLRPCHFTGRRGFTLLELLIVLAIILMIISIASPSVVRMLEKAKFREGVLGLQTELGRTRLLAMKVGKPLVFRYQTGTNRYQVIPRFSSDPAPESFSKGYVRAGKEGEVPSEAAFGVVRELEGDAIFMGGVPLDGEENSWNAPMGEFPEDDAGSRVIGSLSTPTLSPSSGQFSTGQDFGAFEGTERGDRSDGTMDGWSDPVIFYPNGRTSSAVIFLRSVPDPGKTDYFSEVSIRGLTGTARISTISIVPPGSPDFPSVLSEETLSRWRNPMGGGPMNGKNGGINGISPENFSGVAFPSDGVGTSLEITGGGTR